MSKLLVIFDCDGVLVDSEPITNRVMAENLTRHGLPISKDECIELFVGGTIQGVFETARKLGAKLPEDWVPMIYEEMFEVLTHEVEAIPGVKDVLDQLDEQSVDYCVASNGPMRKMEITLGRTGLWTRFSGRIFSAHDVGSAKPDPGLFLHAADALGYQASDCIVVEDLASGASAAKAASMRCIGFARDTPPHKLSDQGAKIFYDMAEISNFITVETRT